MSHIRSKSIAISVRWLYWEIRFGGIWILPFRRALFIVKADSPFFFVSLFYHSTCPTLSTSRPAIFRTILFHVAMCERDYIPPHLCTSGSTIVQIKVPPSKSHVSKIEPKGRKSKPRGHKQRYHNQKNTLVHPPVVFIVALDSGMYPL